MAALRLAMPPTFVYRFHWATEGSKHFGVKVADQPTEQLRPERPTGRIEPADEQARKALRALEQHHRQEADRIIAHLPDGEPADRAWRAYLLGEQALERGELTGAAESLVSAVALAFEWALPPRQRPLEEALRLAGRALHLLGWVRRRQDAPDEALRSHQAAYGLRTRHGSVLETWETAVELGLDAELTRDSDLAQQWLKAAAELGSTCPEEPDRCQAVAWTHLSTSLIASRKFEEAVNAARSAKLYWQAYDPAAATCAQADLRLGHALLKAAEALAGHDAERARAHLDNSLEALDTARESLLAFGAGYEQDTHWCDEQRDFARRLCAALEV